MFARFKAIPWHPARLKADEYLFGLGICAVPVSIAISEAFLSASLILRLPAIFRRRGILLPRVFWYWLVWAAAEVAAWLFSPDVRAGLGEMRHILLIAGLFLLVPAVERTSDRVTIWGGVLAGATLSSVFLIGHFVYQLMFYRGPLAPVIYLRSGGLLHHWMVYATVEVLVFAALLEMWRSYPERRRWLLPVLVLNTAAILLSLTRVLWVCCLLLLVLHLAWRRSRWIWAVPVIPCLLFSLAPNAVRSRLSDSLHPDYYSNAERIQMLRVGWSMIREKPLVGIGPGRVDRLYTQYLAPEDPVPAYHGHLHNNLVQLGAEFGVPATLAGLIFIGILFRDLWRRYQSATGRDEEFLCRTSLLGLTGFIAAGLFEYTYGHSLGLILVAFTVLSPLVPAASSGASTKGSPSSREKITVGTALE
jgi:O-antigen ligase